MESDRVSEPATCSLTLFYPKILACLYCMRYRASPHLKLCLTEGSGSYDDCADGCLFAVLWKISKKMNKTFFSNCCDSISETHHNLVKTLTRKFNRSCGWPCQPPPPLGSVLELSCPNSLTPPWFPFFGVLYLTHWDVSPSCIDFYYTPNGADYLIIDGELMCLHALQRNEGCDSILYLKRWEFSRCGWQPCIHSFCEYSPNSTKMTPCLRSTTIGNRSVRAPSAVNVFEFAVNHGFPRTTALRD